MDDQHVEKNDMYKVGVKILSDTQLKNILPTYNNIMEKIEVCRRVANDRLDTENDENKKRRYQDNLMYDNVFSVLGKRGTGKTSVAFTLQKKIEEIGHSEYDVVLPLIIPEVIPENCTVLGWILAIVKEEMEVLEENIHEEERKTGGEQNRSRYRYSGERTSEKSLVAKLDEISQMFFAGSYNPSNEESYYRAIGYSVQQAGDYYRFAKEISDLWGRWIKRIREYYKLKEGDKRTICPMIYFIFDDVDLAPEKIDELLSVIIKYLSHPNIIVITTADERLFLEVIEKQLDQKIGRIPGEWREYLNHNQEYPFAVIDTEEKRRKKDFEDVVNQTAAMYLGKVLPPSTRYYLRLFQTAKQKENFYVRDGETLGNAISRQISELISCIDGKHSNFMVVNNALINFYLKFIGDTSRQISNVYVVLSELVCNLKKIAANMKKDNTDIDNVYIEEQINELYQECRYFLRVTLNSNHNLTRTIENIDEFVDEVFLPEYNQWQLYINYLYINEYVEDNAVIGNGSEEEERAVKVEVALQLYSLFAFLENMLLLMEDVFPKGITGRKKVHAISFMAEYIQGTAFENRHIFREDLPANDFFEHYNNLLDRLKSIVSDEKVSDRKFSMEYFYNLRKYELDRKSNGRRDSSFPNRAEVGRSARNNPKWFNQLVRMLTMVYGNAYLFAKDDMADCLTFKDKKCLVRYQRKICSVLQEYMDKCFANIKLQDVWGDRKWKENLQKRYEEPDIGNKGFSALVYTVQEEMIQMSEEGKEAFSREYYESPDITAERERTEERLADEKKHQMVELSLVLENVFKHLKPDRHIEGMGNLQSLLMQCPFDVVAELIRSLKADTFNRETLKKLLSDRIEAVEKAEYWWNNGGILFELSHTLEVFERLFRLNSSKYGELKWIARELDVPDTSEVVALNKSSYRKLVNTLSRMLEKHDMSREVNRYYEDEEEALREEAKMLFQGWDICVDIYNTEAVRRAVQLGTEVALIGFLQAAYLYQTVYERYMGNNSLSSKELERVGDKNTYYYNFFNRVVEILAEKNEKENKKDINLRERIETVYTNERQKYVELLIARVRDE